MLQNTASRPRPLQDGETIDPRKAAAYRLSRAAACLNAAHHARGWISEAYRQDAIWHIDAANKLLKDETCPYCGRVLDGHECNPGLCDSDDCPQHD